MEINRGRHCVFDIKIHLVFIPKYRKNIFTPRVLEQLEIIFKETCQKLEAELIEFKARAITFTYW